MMSQTPTPNPPELVLLKKLWAQGPLPVRVLHDACADQLDWSFSSTRKTLTRMSDKGLVVYQKPEAKGVALYTARVSKTATLANMARDFMRRVLEVDGPLPHVVFSASKLLNDEELEELEGLLGG
ncbi:MAG: penicillinase repressor [Robiginitomaculum sp.]|nr:MAG: penicillinase repressor [Robiginitomaculum sp.]